MPGASHWIETIFRPIQTTPNFLLAVLACVVVFVAVMAALHKLSPQVRSTLTVVLTFVAGLFFALEFFIPARHKGANGEMQNFLTPWQDPVSNFVTYMAVWVLGMGVISLSLVHGRRLLKAKPGWHNSLAFFITMIGVMVVGFWTSAGNGGPAVAQTIYNSLYFGLLQNLDAAMFALLAFYIASAAYRAFRVRTVEAGLLMAAALIIMLGLVEFGIWITGWIPADSHFAVFRLQRLSQLILSWINMPVYRAVVIGVAIGSLAMSMRLWLSLERGTFFSRER